MYKFLTLSIKISSLMPLSEYHGNLMWSGSVNYGTILLLQYPQGHWDLPKGHVEDDDVDKHATAARELAEETGISEIEFVTGF